MYAYAGKSICQESGYCIVKRKACQYAVWIKESQVVFHKIKTRNQSQPQQEFRDGKAGW